MLVKWFLIILLSNITGRMRILNGRTYIGVYRGYIKKVICKPSQYSSGTKLSHAAPTEIPIMRSPNVIIDTSKFNDPKWKYIRDTRGRLPNYFEDVTVDFQGISDHRCAPPDVQIAAGYNVIGEAINCKIAFFSKTGNLLFSRDIRDFFSPLNPSSDGFFSDPKIAFDPDQRKWIILVLFINSHSHESFYYLAVSELDNPLGWWILYELNASMDGNNPSNNWADYPGLGFNNWGIFITSNQFRWDDHFSYGKIRVLDKQSVYNGTLDSWYDFCDYDYFSIKPAQSLTPADTEFFLMSNPLHGSHVYACSVTRQNGIPVISSLIAIPVQYYHYQGSASQRGSGTPLDAGDSRMQDVTYFNGAIYGSFTEMNPVNTNLAAIRFLCIDPFNWSVISDITFGSDYSNYFYPRVAVSPYQIVMIFARSGDYDYAGVAYTTAFYPYISFEQSEWLKTGESYYDITGWANRNRWGDYFGAYFDPTDSSVWIAGEYAVAPQRYGTWIGKVHLSNAQKGDVNRDGERNIFDVVRMVDIALSVPPEPTPYERWAADMNSDGNIDILDVVSLVNVILNGGKSSYPEPSSIEAAIYTEDNNVILRNYGNISGLQFDLMGDIEDITLNEVLRGFELFSHNTDNGKKIIILSPRGEVIKPGTWSILRFKGRATLSKVVLSDEWGRKVRLTNEFKQSQATLKVIPDLLHTTGTIEFSIPNPMRVDISVFDASGRRVISIVDNRFLHPGIHKFPINVTHFASGVYFVVARTSFVTLQKKLVVRK